ncbi:MAG TPA: hypothetical protein VD905_06425 [Flavobacteriales bacterium]|nr:hypothetical protein [Flavobacteriales bacterium]
MKHVTSITGINFFVLLVALVILTPMEFNNSFVYFIPVIALVVLNFLVGTIYYLSRERERAKRFMLSGLIVFVIGSSSCVTIVPRERKPKPPKEKPVTEAVATVTFPAALEGRKGTVQHSYRTSSASVTIQLFEYANVDGDTVSLYFNNNWLVKEYAVVKETRGFELELKQGQNDLLLYAESLGSTPPNTAAIRIIDGDKEKLFILNSDYSHCGALRFYRE